MMERYDREEPVNIGSGSEISIRALAAMMGEVTGFTGEILFDDAKPDGTPRKFLDSSRMTAMAWAPKIELPEGLQQTYAWFRESVKPASLKKAG
jgi:GDP-L-fucose synthase